MCVLIEMRTYSVLNITTLCLCVYCATFLQGGTNCFTFIFNSDISSLDDTNSYKNSVYPEPSIILFSPTCQTNENKGSEAISVCTIVHPDRTEQSTNVSELCVELLCGSVWVACWRDTAITHTTIREDCYSGGN